MHTHQHRHLPHTLRTHARRKDPTGTTSIRVRFEKEMRSRFNELSALIKKAVNELDVFALKTNIRATLPGRKAFDFTRSGDKVGAFMEWLKHSEDQVIFDQVVGTPIRSAARTSWANVYIDSAYQKGLASAAAELRASGVKVSDRYIDSAFFRPVHADRVGMIYTRSYSDLVGITDAMDTKISRVLAQGLAEGRSPLVIARDLVKQVEDIGIVRARMLARTEVISAHADATINSYREAGLEGVNVRSEWSTAGDELVCPECEDMEGKTFTLDEAEGMLPLHPNCRCAWIPVVLDPEGKELN